MMTTTMRFTAAALMVLVTAALLLAFTFFVTAALLITSAPATHGTHGTHVMTNPSSMNGHWTRGISKHCINFIHSLVHCINQTTSFRYNKRFASHNPFNVLINDIVFEIFKFL